MIRKKNIVGRMIDTTVLACPLLAVGALCGALGLTSISYGLFTAAGVLFMAAALAPRAGTMVNAYFERFLAGPAKRLADALLVTCYAVMIPAGLVLRLRQRAALRKRPASFWRNT